MASERTLPTRAWIAVGANLGDRASTIASAVDAIAALPGVRIASRSSLLDTPAFGGPAGQPDFLNGALGCRLDGEWNSLDPRDAARRLLDRLLSIERSLGRTRDPRDRNAARTIDLDLLLVEGRDGAVVLDEPGLEIPHPRLHERRFVLEPLAEIAPDLQHPRLGRTVRELLAGLPPP